MEVQIDVRQIRLPQRNHLSPLPLSHSRLTTPLRVADWTSRRRQIEAMGRGTLTIHPEYRRSPWAKFGKFLASSEKNSTWATGYLAAYWIGVDHRGRVQSATALVARGGFSITIAGLGASLEPRIGPFAAAYVLMPAVGGRLLTRAAK